MAGERGDPNIFIRSTGVRCPGAHCDNGEIMHRRTYETEPIEPWTPMGYKLRGWYVDAYFCSKECGVACAKPGAYQPAVITDWDPALEALRKMADGLGIPKITRVEDENEDPPSPK